MAAQVEAQGYADGTPIWGLYVLALFASGLMSGGSLAFGALAFRDLPSPRSRVRVAELVVVSVPLLLATAVAVRLFVAAA